MNSRGLVSLIWLAFTVILLGNCTPKNGTKSNAERTSGDTHGIYDPLHGTSDQGGGGDLIKGRPIDYYVIDVTSLPFYKKIIQPMDELFSSRFLPDNPVAFFKNIAQSKTWYLLPVSLKGIPKEKIGVTVATIPGAVQNTNQIFLSELDLQKADAEEYPELKTMTPDERRAWLVTHEIVMAFYRYRFEKFAVYCHIYLGKSCGNTDNAKGVTKESFDITDKSFEPIQQKEFLLPQQYEPIRHVTNWIMNNYQTATKRDIWMKFFEKGFDPRFFSPNYIQSEWGDFKPKKVSRDDFLKRLMIQQEKEMLPSKCGYEDEYPIRSSHDCQVSFSFANERLTVSVQVLKDGREVGKFTTPLDFPKTTGYQDKNNYLLAVSGFREDGVTYTLELKAPESEPTAKRQLSVRFHIKDVESPYFTISSIFFERAMWVENTKNNFHAERIPLKNLEAIFELIGDRAEIPARLEEFRHN